METAPTPERMEAVVVDNIELLRTVIDSFPTSSSKTPSFYLDIEGQKLSRHGTLDIVQLYIPKRKFVYLFDVTTLGKDAFHTKGAQGHSIKSILESPDIIKVFFDVRCDANALYGHFKVKLAGIHDLQLMECATRQNPRPFLNGLAKCIQNDIRMESGKKSEWHRNKELGKKLFAPERGGSYAIFAERPLKEEIKTYCAQDVVHLPKLWEEYSRKIDDSLWKDILRETESRIKASESDEFEPGGSSMVCAPVGLCRGNDDFLFY